MSLKCLPCCGEMVQAKVRSAKGEDVEIPEPADALTMAPDWQQQITMGQMVMACVTVPVCERHLNVQEMSAADQAIRGGNILLGQMG